MNKNNSNIGYGMEKVNNLQAHYFGSVFGFRVLWVLYLPLLVISCADGVSQKEYVKVKSDLAVAQAQVESLQSYAKAVESQLDTVEPL